MFLYNGFQSLVQLSEEAKNQNDIPRSLISSLISSAIVYSLFAVSVVALLGSKLASKSKMSLIDAFRVVLSDKKSQYNKYYNNHNFNKFGFNYFFIPSFDYFKKCLLEE